jgi:hypothetical protein
METEPPLDKSLLDSPTTPQENTEKNKSSRTQSTGITSLVDNMNLTKKTVGSGAGKSRATHSESDDDCAFRKNSSGDPTQPQIQRARIHAGTNTGDPASVAKGAEKPADAGNGTDTGAGAGSLTNTERAKNAKSFEFPPAYYNVRKQRANASSYVELPTVEGNRRKSATCVKIQPGFELKGDDRQHRVYNYHIPALCKNVSASVARKEDELWCVSCNESHSFNNNDPVVVILTDQNFSPMVPATDKKCCVVLRLEDSLLSELPGVLKEFFGNRTRYLPEGSLLIFGSLSHLVSRGPENYAEEAVKMAKVFSNMLDRSCSITHTVFLPLGGVESPGIIRDMYDVDCWLKSGSISSSFSLPATRNAVWQIFCDENKGDQNLIEYCERTLFLPESLRESKKIRTVAGNTGNLPKKLKPISAEGEITIIHTLMHEIADIYALNVELEPVLARCSVGPASSKKNSGRIFAIGASHVSRIVGGLVALDMEIVNLSRPGWTASKDNITDCAAKLKSYAFNSADTILIDPFSNSIFCGTDPEGNPKDSVRDADGKWHIEGDLVFRPRSVIKKTLNYARTYFGTRSRLILSLCHWFRDTSRANAARIKTIFRTLTICCIKLK